MAAEARQGEAEQPAKARSRAGAAPRTRRAHPAAGPWPHEIGFLGAQGVAPALLLRAAEVAAATGVPADVALLGEGFPEDTFYRMLARHLGVPYLERPMRLETARGEGPQAWDAGIAPLAFNDRNLDYVLAPRGAFLRTLLHHVRPGGGRLARIVIASPRCLAALVRRHDRSALLHQASHGLAAWDTRLSAKAGITRRQKQVAIGTALAACCGAAVSPLATFGVAMAALWLMFLAAVVLRLCATVSSAAPAPKPRGPVPDHELPVYTIVVPLYREARIVPDLVSALDAIDYPVLGSKLTKG